MRLLIGITLDAEEVYFDGIENELFVKSIQYGLDNTRVELVPTPAGANSYSDALAASMIGILLHRKEVFPVYAEHANGPLIRYTKITLHPVGV